MSIKYVVSFTLLRKGLDRIVLDINAKGFIYCYLLN